MKLRATLVYSVVDCAIIAALLVCIFRFVEIWPSAANSLNSSIVSHQQIPPLMRSDAVSSLVAREAWNGGSERNVVLVVSADCTYCEQSVGFYKTIATAMAGQGDGSLVVLSSDQPAQIEGWLKKASLTVSRVQTVTNEQLHSVGIMSTPIVIEVGTNAEMVAAWYGKLNESEERDVLGGLTPGTSRVNSDLDRIKPIFREAMPGLMTDGKGLIIDLRPRDGVVPTRVSGFKNANIPASEMALRIGEVRDGGSVVLDCITVTGQQCLAGALTLTHRLSIPRVSLLVSK